MDFKGNNFLTKERLLWLTLLAIAIVIITYHIVIPKTPVDYAELHSGLNLPSGIGSSVNFQNIDLSNGDVIRTIVFDLTEEHLLEIEKECMAKSYKQLPINDSFSKPGFLNQSDRGYYKFKLLSKSGYSYKVTILDISKKKLFVQIII